MFASFGHCLHCFPVRQVVQMFAMQASSRGIRGGLCGTVGTRMAARELAEVGVPNRLTWQVVEEHGTNALGALTQDPYTTLRPLRGYSFRCVATCIVVMPDTHST